jgi:hypothetical protein
MKNKHHHLLQLQLINLLQQRQEGVAELNRNSITLRQLLDRRPRLKCYVETMASCQQPFSSIAQLWEYIIRNLTTTANKSKHSSAMKAVISLFTEIR